MINLSAASGESKPKVKPATIISFVVLLALILLIDPIGPLKGTVKPIFGLYVSRIIKTSAIYAICALSMNMVNGFTGLFSLGQPGFMAIGAYTCALLTLSPANKNLVFYLEPISPWLLNLNAPFIVAMILGGILAAAAAFVVGFPVLRLKGDYLAIASLGFSEIIRIILLNAQPVTNGAVGISKIPGHVSLLLAMFVMGLVAAFMLIMMKTTYGRALKAIREDEVAAEAMGVNLFRHKLLAFILSGFMAGIGGALLASLVGAIDPNQFRFTLAYTLLLMVVLGGQGSISGSIVGAFIITIAQEALRFVDAPIPAIGYPGVNGMRMVVFSVLLMCIILFWSRGIFGSEEFSWKRIADFFKNRAGKKKREGGALQ